MADEPLQIGDLVEILQGERPRGQPAAQRRYAQVVALADENGRATVRVQGRQYPLHVPVSQLRRVAPYPSEPV